MDKENVRQTVLDFLQESGFQFRDKFNLVDARLEENPVRLVVTSYDNLPKEDVEAFVNNVNIQLEIQKLAPPVVLTGDITVGDGDAVISSSEKPKMFSHFNKEDQKKLNLTDALGPNVSESDVQGDNKKKAFEAWKKRNSNVKFEE